MAVTLVELAQRVEALERDVDLLKNGKGPRPRRDPRETEFARQSRENQRSLDEAWQILFNNLGIKSEPIGAENLQARIAQHLQKKGIKPEDCIFSREIIAMREE